MLTYVSSGGSVYGTIAFFCRETGKRRFFTIRPVAFFVMISPRASLIETLRARQRCTTKVVTEHIGGEAALDMADAVGQKRISSLDRKTMPLAIPREGVWLRLALTLEGTIRRSSNARQNLCPQQFNEARIHWTSDDLVFLQSALERLYRTHGRIRIDELAAECALSLRQFERRFKQRIGVSPKMFARILRFEALLDSFIREPAFSFADAASRLGYHDQAHVIHEFKTWAGCTPTAFIERAKQRRLRGPIAPDPRSAYEPLYIV